MIRKYIKKSSKPSLFDQITWKHKKQYATNHHAKEIPPS